MYVHILSMYVHYCFVEIPYSCTHTWYVYSTYALHIHISTCVVCRHLTFIFPTTSAGRQKGGLTSTPHDGASLNTGAKVSSKEPLSYEEDFVSERY